MSDNNLKQAMAAVDAGMAQAAERIAAGAGSPGIVMGNVNRPVVGAAHLGPKRMAMGEVEKELDAFIDRMRNLDEQLGNKVGALSGFDPSVTMRKAGEADTAEPADGGALGRLSHRLATLNRIAERIEVSNKALAASLA